MRRLLFVATGAFFVVATLLPTQRSFVVSAVSDGERLAMFSKPAVVRIIDGGMGQILFRRQVSRRRYITFKPSPWAPGSSSVPMDTLPPTRTSSR